MNAQAKHLGAKKNRVWSDVLVEQTLCEDILKINGLETSSEKSGVKREAESYEVKKQENPLKREPKAKQKKKKKKRGKKRLNEKTAKTDLSANLKNLDKKILNQIKTEYSNQTTTAAKRNDFAVLSDDCFNVLFDETKYRGHIKASELDSDEIVCKEITKQLNEKKSDLIMRCVKVLGRKKSLDLLYATQDIEDKGGMFTDDGYRRRTPGGIFIQLVKNDRMILSVQKKSILIQSIEEKKAHKKRKRLSQKLKFQRTKAQCVKDDQKSTNDCTIETDAPKEPLDAGHQQELNL